MVGHAKHGSGTDVALDDPTGVGLALGEKPIVLAIAVSTGFEIGLASARDQPQGGRTNQ